MVKNANTIYNYHFFEYSSYKTVAHSSKSLVILYYDEKKSQFISFITNIVKDRLSCSYFLLFKYYYLSIHSIFMLKIITYQLNIRSNIKFVQNFKLLFYF